MTETNKQFLLASRPQGQVSPDNFRLVERPVPEIGEGEVLVRNHYLSLDPYMRGRMDDAKSYAAPQKLDEVMQGGTVGEVVASRNPAFAVGDKVLAMFGWQLYGKSDGSLMMKLDTSRVPIQAYLGCVGMPGITGWYGLNRIIEPKAGETVVVSAASGAVGSVVGQLAKQKGCRVVGVAGGAEKCRAVTEEFGFDACVDYKAGNLRADLKAATPDGIDVYFENVGGKVFDAVRRRLNTYARIPVCGLVANYNATSAPDGPDQLPGFLGQVLTQSLTVRGFIQDEFTRSHGRDFVRDMGEWVRSGQVRYREDVVEGLENAPAAFAGMLRGENFGKLVVKVSG